MIRFSFIVISCFLLNVVATGASASDSILEIGEFSLGNLSDWKEKEFDGETTYKIASLDNQSVLEANSQSAASGRYKEITIDIKQYPYLNWSWRVEQALPRLNETEKEGDDYAVRIYVVKSGGFFFWKTKALNYVWSSRDQEGAQWPNAFAPGNARMMAVRSSKDSAGQWYQEKRNVYLDLKNWLGEEIDEIDGIAIMTDTDNSGLSARAFYGDIYFSKQ